MNGLGALFVCCGGVELADRIGWPVVTLVSLPLLFHLVRDSRLPPLPQLLSAQLLALSSGLGRTRVDRCVSLQLRLVEV